jgi:hypothetical protein
MRKSLFGSSVLVVLCLYQMTASAAPARAPRGEANALQQAIVECRQAYGGDRGKAVNQVKSIWVENCFKTKTGRFPFEVGIPLYPLGYDWYLNPDRY